MRPLVVAHSFGAGPVAEAVLSKPEAFAGLIIVAGAIGLNAHLEPVDMPALLDNELFRRLAVSGNASNPRLTKTLLRNLIHVKDTATYDVIDVLQQPMTRAGYTHAVTQWVPSLLSSPHEALSTRPENWRALSLPTFLIWGDKDTVTPLSQGETLAEIIPNATLTMLPDVGHIPQIEASALFQSNLLSALNALSKQTDH